MDAYYGPNSILSVLYVLTHPHNSSFEIGIMIIIL